MITGARESPRGRSSLRHEAELVLRQAALQLNPQPMVMPQRPSDGCPDERATVAGDRGPLAVSRWRILWPIAMAVLIVSASGRSRISGPSIEHIDKMAHFAVYGLLATLICRLGRSWSAAGWALIIVSIFGASDEWHQSFVPGRSPEMADWVADTAGAATAIMMYFGWGRYRRMLETPLRWPGRRRKPRKLNYVRPGS